MDADLLRDQGAGQRTQFPDTATQEVLLQLADALADTQQRVAALLDVHHEHLGAVGVLANVLLVILGGLRQRLRVDLDSLDRSRILVIGELGVSRRKSFLQRTLPSLAGKLVRELVVERIRPEMEELVVNHLDGQFIVPEVDHHVGCHKAGIRRCAP